MSWADDYNASIGLTPKSQSKKVENKKKKNFLVDQISTVGGIIGGIGGGVGGAALGGVGAIPGAAVGSAGGSALGETLENLLMGESLTKNVGKEALIGGVTAIPPIKAAKLALGIKEGAKVGVKEVTKKAGRNFGQRLADKTYAQAFTIPKTKGTQHLNPEKTASELMQYGIGGSLDKIGGTSQNVLSQVGKLVDESVSGIGGQIQAGDVTGVANRALRGVKVSGPDRNALMERLTDIGTTGKLPGYAAPSELLDTARTLERRGFDRVRAGTNNLSQNPDMVDLGGAYIQSAKEIEDNLYNAISRSGSLKAVQTPENAQVLNGIAQGLGDRFVQAKDLGEVRSLMAPFVNAKNMVNLTQTEATSAGSQGLGNLAGRGAGAGVGGMLAGLPGAAAGFFAAPLMRGLDETLRAPIATGVAKGLNKISGGARAAAPEAAGGFGAGQRLGLAGRVGAGGTASSALSSAEVPQQADSLESLLTLSAGQQQVEEPQQQAGGVSRENLMMAIAMDAQQTGGKNIDTLMQIFEMMNPEPVQETAKRPTEAMVARAESLDLARRASDMFDAGSIETGPIGSRLESLKGKFNMGDQETLDFNATASALRAAIAKARGGSSFTPTEEKMLDQYVPKEGDSAQTIRTKLNNLMVTLQSTNAAGASAGSLEELIAQGAYQ